MFKVLKIARLTVTQSDEQIYLICLFLGRGTLLPNMLVTIKANMEGWLRDGEKRLVE